MTKVVYNACYGGFSLSKEACRRYWEIQGKQIWFGRCESLGVFTVWLVPPNERISEPKNFNEMSFEERISRNKKVNDQTWSCCYVARHDPVLVQVVEELGERANGPHAKLAIQEVCGPYRIDEYDGYESVQTPDDYDWIIPD